MGLDIKRNNNMSLTTKIVSFATILLVSCVLLTFLYHYYFSGLATVLLFYIILTLDLIPIIAGIILLIKRKKDLILVIGVSIFLINLIAPFISTFIGDFESRKTEARAEIIIEALEAYYQDNKSYPLELQKLKKDYLPEIPKTYSIAAKESEFEYFLEDSGYYVLTYYRDDSYPMVYYSIEKGWSPRPLP